MPSEKVDKIITENFLLSYWSLSGRIIDEDLTKDEMLELASRIISYKLEDGSPKEIKSLLLSDAQKSFFLESRDKLEGGEERIEEFFNALNVVQKCDLEKIPKALTFVALGKKIPQEFLQNIRNISSAAIAKGLEVKIIVQKDADFLSCAARQDVEFFSGSLKRVKLVTIDQVFTDAKSGPLFNSDSIVPDEFVEGEKISGERAFGVLKDFVDSSMIGLKNLATVSDILRYMYLEQFGGYYLDWDMYIESYLKRAPKDKEEIPEAYDFGFKVSAHLKRREVYGGSDMLGSPPHHTITQIALQKAVSHIESRNASDPQLARSYKDCDSTDYLHRLAPRFTAGMDLGPGCLLGSVQKYFHHFYPKSEEMFYPLFAWTLDGMFGTTLSSKSAGLWAKKPKDLPTSFDDSTLRTTSKPWSLWDDKTKRGELPDRPMPEATREVDEKELRQTKPVLKRAEELGNEKKTSVVTKTATKPRPKWDDRGITPDERRENRKRDIAVVNELSNSSTKKSVTSRAGLSKAVVSKLAPVKSKSGELDRK